MPRAAARATNLVLAVAIVPVALHLAKPGTGKVKDPDAGPNVLAPPITTPPLK